MKFLKDTLTSVDLSKDDAEKINAIVIREKKLNLFISYVNGVYNKTFIKLFGVRKSVTV